MMRAAIRYASIGWAVFPLHTPTEGGCSCRHEDCSRAGKHPRTKNGFLDGSTDQAQIERWWGMWPDANIGVACGKSGVVAIDVDPRHGGEESFADLCRKVSTDLRETVVSVTGGGGAHYVYTAPRDPVDNSQSVLGPGIDVRGHNGYICVAPSMHESGQRYEWERSPLEFSLAVFPAAELVVQMPRREKSAPIGETIPAGQRDHTLTSLAGTMRRRGMGEDSILAALRAENTARCVPPLPDGDLQRIARSVGRYAPSGDIPVSTGITTYQRLRKVATEPPSYVLEVSGRDVKLTTAQLVAHTALRTATLEQSDQAPARMKAVEWDDTLAVLLTDMEILPAPEDASERGLIWSLVVDILRLRGDQEEQLAQGKAVELNGEIYVTGTMLREGLRARGVVVEQRKIWDAVRGCGAQNKVVRFKEKTHRVWAIPVEALP